MQMIKLIAVESGVSKTGKNWFRGSFKLTRAADGRSALITEWLSDIPGKKALAMTQGGAEPRVHLELGYDDSFRKAIIDIRLDDEFGEIDID